MGPSTSFGQHSSTLVRELKKMRRQTLQTRNRPMEPHTPAGDEPGASNNDIVLKYCRAWCARATKLRHTTMQTHTTQKQINQQMSPHHEKHRPATTKRAHHRSIPPNNAPHCPSHDHSPGWGRRRRSANTGARWSGSSKRWVVKLCRHTPDQWSLTRLRGMSQRQATMI